MARHFLLSAAARTLSLKAIYKAGEDAAYPEGGAPGGGLSDAEPQASTPIRLDDIVSSRFWEHLRTHTTYRHHAPMFQPVGGMEEIAKAFHREVAGLITHNARVLRIMQDSGGVTVEYDSADGTGSGTSRATADWCVCTIPFSVLSQIDIDVSADMRQAMRDLHYHEAMKAGMEMKRRFWEQDHAIYGGITYTDLPIAEISYPSSDLHSQGPGVLLSAYVYGPETYVYNGMSPEERLASVRRYGAMIHPEIETEYASGVALSWHRVPWMLGCYSNWDVRDHRYRAAAQVDRRIVCAGEHLSYIPGWMEGSILSTLDAITRLNEVAASGLYNSNGQEGEAQ